MIPKNQVTTSSYVNNFTFDKPVYLPGGGVLDANSAYGTIPAGTLLGMITATKKYAPSIIGLTTDIYTSGDLTIQVSPDTAKELNRRIGQSGTVAMNGLVAGVVTARFLIFSKIDLDTGVITCADILTTFASGAYIYSTSGSASPITVLLDSVDVYGKDINIPVVIGGTIDMTTVYQAPPSVLLRDYLLGRLNIYGKFVEVK